MKQTLIRVIYFILYLFRAFSYSKIIFNTENTVWKTLIIAIKPVPQAHLIYAEVTEAKQQFDQLAEDNRKAITEAKEREASFQNNQTHTDSVELEHLG